MVKRVFKFFLFFLIFISMINIVIGANLTFNISIFINKKPVYTIGESVLSGFSSQFTLNELTVKLGKPKNVKKEMKGKYVYHVYNYDWGNLMLAPSAKKNFFYIVSAEISKKGVKGPRGIEIGDDYKRVISSFRCDPKKVKGKEYLYYIKTDKGEQFGYVITNKKGEIESIVYQDSLSYKIEFKIQKDKVSKIIISYHSK